MNTVIGYTAQPEVGKTGMVLQTLLFLGRKFLGQTDTRIQHKHSGYSRKSIRHVPPRVWKRHSALLGMIMQQTEFTEVKPSDTE